MEAKTFTNIKRARRVAREVPSTLIELHRYFSTFIYLKTFIIFTSSILLDLCKVKFNKKQD